MPDIINHLFLNQACSSQDDIQSIYTSFAHDSTVSASDDDSSPHWWTTDIAPISWPTSALLLQSHLKCDWIPIQVYQIIYWLWTCAFYIVMCNCQLSHIIPSTIKLGNNTSSVGPFQWHHTYHHWKYSQYKGGRYLVSLAQGTFRSTLKVQTLNRTVSPRVTTFHHNHVARQKIQTASTM